MADFLLPAMPENYWLLLYIIKTDFGIRPPLSNWREPRSGIRRCKVRDLWSVISVMMTFSSWFSPCLDQIIIMNKSAVFLVQPPEIQPIRGSRYLGKKKPVDDSQNITFISIKKLWKVTSGKFMMIKNTFIISVDKISHICRLNFVQDNSVTSIWTWKYKLIHFAIC